MPVVFSGSSTRGTRRPRGRDGILESLDATFGITLKSCSSSSVEDRALCKWLIISSYRASTCSSTYAWR